MLSQHRREAITATAARIEELYQARENAVNELMEIDQSLNYMHVAMANLAPIHYLPNEILSLIFEFGYRGPRYKKHLPFPVMVSHISRRWRDVAHNTAVIWTYIRLTGTQPMSYLSKFLTLSQGRPLDVLINFCMRKDLSWKVFQEKSIWTMTKAYIGRLVPHVSRWRRLSLFASRTESMGVLFGYLADLHAPILEYLEIHLDDLEKIYLALSAIFTGGAPSLSHLRVSNLKVYDWSCPLANITQLFIRSFEKRCSNYDELCELLTACPNLTRLSLGGVDLKDVDPDAEPFELSNLTHLALDYTVWLKTMLTIIAVPALTYLELSNIAKDSFAGFIAAVQRPNDPLVFPAVETLALWHLHAKSEALDETFIRAFPALQHLALVNTNPRPFLAILNLPAPIIPDIDHLSSPFWHALQTLTLTSLEPEDQQALRDVVHSHIRVGRPLVCLCLGHTIRLDFGVVEWLRGCVRLEQFSVSDRMSADRGSDELLLCPGHNLYPFDMLPPCAATQTDKESDW